ncbi:hypothetical protein BJY00DRAFT_16153 [Aspergillus carlsbadensis]|nr:hypothetical protein BJY00DRAFT_16153 [Aspergillus carlsbadensis]
MTEALVQRQLTTIYSYLALKVVVYSCVVYTFFTEDRIDLRKQISNAIQEDLRSRGHQALHHLVPDDHVIHRRFPVPAEWTWESAADAHCRGTSPQCCTVVQVQREQLIIVQPQTRMFVVGSPLKGMRKRRNASTNMNRSENLAGLLKTVVDE